ncbi:hypothetical protein COCOBI_13-2180 [Coccomyxa sp. Obi]|nr:hypothetical protein COCOBI_13-2180 [Coccomyxa sp. Obi]
MEQPKDEIETPRGKVQTKEAKEEEESPKRHIGFEPIDPFKWDLCAPEDDPIMGRHNRAMLAGTEETAVEGETGAGMLDPVPQQVYTQFNSNQKMLECLQVTLGRPAKQSQEDDKVKQWQKKFDEERAQGREPTGVELLADIESLSNDIKAALDYNTKVLEIMASMAPDLAAAEPL